MSGEISVSPLGRMPSAALAAANPRPPSRVRWMKERTRTDTIDRGAQGYECMPVDHAGRYQFTFAPMRATRGGTMLVGRRNDDPDAQVMFCTGFALNTL